jgi:NADH-quinone oxidoreductase subunit C
MADASDIADTGMPGSEELIASLIAPFEAIEAEERKYASSDVTYHAITVPMSDWVPFAVHALDLGFDTFIDLFAVDHFRDAPRFEVTLNLLSMTANERILISTRVPYDDPSLPTLTDVFAGANFYEREVYDLLGVDFVGHPDLTRILMPDDWEGHPLRKDYDIGAVPVRFKAGSSEL